MSYLIERPFADQGDKREVPQTDPNGFVNQTQGYTPDYEIDLNSNNPQAKAVERAIQNWLFNMITGNLQFWQKHSYPEWFSGMAGGYEVGAMVVRETPEGEWRPYRSIVANNVSDPINSPSQWAYVKSPAEALRDIPMPAGGSAGAAAEVITTGIDFNASRLSNGTFQILNDAVAAQCLNAPNAEGKGRVAGLLEDKHWTDGGTQRAVQRYLDTNGLIFTRAWVGNQWTNWRQAGNAADYLKFAGVDNYTSSITLPNSSIGRYVRWSGATGTLTMFSMASVPGVQGLWIGNMGSGVCTVLMANNESIRTAAGIRTSIALQPGDSAFIASTTAAGIWQLVGGSAELQFSSTFANILTVKGKLNAEGNIELGNQSGTASDAYIDFHNTGTTFDYNARIISPQGTNDIVLCTQTPGGNSAGRLIQRGHGNKEVVNYISSTMAKSVRWQHYGTGTGDTAIMIDLAVEGASWIASFRSSGNNEDNSAGFYVNGIGRFNNSLSVANNISSDAGAIVTYNGTVQARNSTGQIGILHPDGNIQGPQWANPTNSFLRSWLDTNFNSVNNSIQQINSTIVNNTIMNIRLGAQTRMTESGGEAYATSGQVTSGVGDFGAADGYGYQRPIQFQRPGSDQWYNISSI